MMRYLGLVTILACGVVPAGMQAQNSVFGVRGIGFPGRPLSVRARALGGAIGVLDESSAYNPGAVGGFVRMQVSAQSGTTFRKLNVRGTEVTGLQETRFPLGMLGGGVGRSRLAYAVSFSTYMERTYDVTTEDTIQVDGRSVGVTDRIAADGGVVDMRLALAWRANPTFHFGGALHLLNGSSKVTVRREFSDENLAAFDQTGFISFRGVGASVGFVARPSSTFHVGVVGRFDHRLKSTLDEADSRNIDAPVSLRGGARLILSPRFHWSASAGWDGWGVAQEGLTGTATQAFDAWDAGTGLELLGALFGAPLRVGGRYATLPFGPDADQPTEYSLSVGTGRGFGAGRGQFDIALERLFRDGSGMAERAWYVVFGLKIQP